MYEAELLDPAVAGPLADRGLLKKLEAEQFVDRPATVQLSDAMGLLISSGALDKLEASDVFHELSYSRLGGTGAPELASDILRELKSRKLAKDSEDGVSIPMHPLVRGLVLVLLSQILRGSGTKLGCDLSPATDRPQFVQALGEFLTATKIVPSSGNVVAADLATVGVDLSGVPMDEVLGFREQHLDRHRAYARAVRRFVRELSLTPEHDRPRVEEERQMEIRDLANDLKRASRNAWRRPVSFALGLAGAAWTYKTGDPIAAIFGLAAAAAAYESSAAAPNAYSYIFEVGETFRY